MAEPAPIKIGMVWSFTGAATYSLTPDIALAAFFKTHGDTVAGRKVVIIKRDDGGPNPDLARRLTQELVVEDNVDFLIGGAFTPNAAAIAAVSTESKKPYFSTNGATSNLFAKQPYSSRWGFTQPQQVATCATWATKVAGLKRPYTLVADYSPGIDAEKAFTDDIIAQGGTIAGSVRVPITTTDFSAYVQRIKDAAPDSVYVFLPLNGVAFVKAFNAAGLGAHVKVMTNADFSTENNFLQGGDDLIGVDSCFHYTVSHQSRANAEFVKAFEAADPSGKFQPDFPAVATWDIMTAIYKVAAELHGNLDPDKVMAVVKGMKFESPRGPIEIDSDTRGMIENIYMRVIKKLPNGKLVNVEIMTTPLARDPNEH